MRYHNVIWDFDGTLFDSYSAMAAAFGTALKELGISEPVSSIVLHMKVSMGHACEYYQSKFKLEASFFERYKDLRADMENEHLRPFEGVTELCKSIKVSGGANYLFTHRGESAIRFMEKFEVISYFTESVTSSYGFQRKPSPEAILYLMEKYAIKSDDAIMLGDRDLDIQSAKNAGTHNCFFSNGGKGSEIAEINIEHFSEMYDILRIKELS